MRPAFLALVGSIGGCSLFVDLTGLRDTDAGNAPNDAGDATTLDAPTPDAADAGPDVFDFKCPDAAIVCDDFDESPLGARWSGQRISGALLTIDNDAAVSPPNSLLMTLPPNPSTTGRYARLEQNISNLSTIDCEFKFRLDATSATGAEDVRPIALELNASGFTAYEVHIDLESTRFSFVQNTDPSGDAGALSRTELVTMGITLGTWRHVRFTSDFKRAQFAVDGMQVYDKALLSPISKATGKLLVGMTYDSEAPSWTYRIDDVLCVGN